MTALTLSTAPRVSGIADAYQPAIGSAPGWPLVLYFHHVNPDVHHYTAVSPRDFALGLETVLARFRPYDPALLLNPGGPVRPEEPTVLVTFDDGYRDNAVHAERILADYGVPALFFVTTDRLGDRSENARQDFLTWEQCDELASAGHLVAAHTRTHPHLDEIDEESARLEVAGSLAAVAHRYGGSRLFAYPYGGIPAASVVPENVLAFGTVRSPARPWTDAPQAIRRTYLPSGMTETWSELTAYWRESWEIGAGRGAGL